MRMKVSSLPGLLMVVTSLGAFTSTACSSDENLPTEENSTNDDRSDGSRSDGSDATRDSDDTLTSDPTDEVPFGTVIGIGCTRDSDCEAPTRCVREDASFRGSIPGTGICTMPCETHDECGAVDAISYCVPLGVPTDEALAAADDDELPEGAALFCVAACPFGAQELKCGDLATSTCIPLDDGVSVTDTGEEFIFGLCSPLCSSDADCERNEYCDVGWGYCLPDRPKGKALGEACNEGADDECAGAFCLFGVCADPCNLHPDTLICAGGEPGKDARFGCYPHLLTELPSAQNDLGQCLPLCDEDTDCPDALVCYTDDIVSQLYGRGGTCFPAEDTSAGPNDETSTTAPSSSSPSGTTAPPETSAPETSAPETSATSDTLAADAGL